MPTPREKLARSLEALHRLQSRGRVAIRATALSRTDRQRLLAGGFLEEVMKGWYIASRPDEPAGDSTPWYASFWHFCADYLADRFGVAWCLSPEQSLSLHGGNRSVPARLFVRAPKAGNKPTPLLHGTSMFDMRASLPAPNETVMRDALRLFSVPAALIAVSESFFRRAATDVRAAMAAINDASEVLPLLLEGGHSTIAGRLAGAFRHAGQEHIADEIVKTMVKAGYSVRETNPFAHAPRAVLPARERSPYVNRVRLMWQAMRGQVLGLLPASPGPPPSPRAYLAAVDEIYVNDAYHSLSIEGYRVSTDLIERVRRGAWNPDENPEDRENRNALAARGYCDAFVSVKASVERVLAGADAGEVSRVDHRDWYRQLFGPSVTAGIVPAAELAGYRTGPVYIRRSMHVPPPRDAVRDCMSVLFDLLSNETDPAVRVVLGQFVFVYIHPYMDGNGRMGRFLMNVMLASGGHPWTIIPLERRNDYMTALEAASVGQDVRPFARFIGGLLEAGRRGRTAAEKNSPRRHGSRSGVRDASRDSGRPLRRDESPRTGTDQNGREHTEARTVRSGARRRGPE